MNALNVFLASSFLKYASDRSVFSSENGVARSRVVSLEKTDGVPVSPFRSPKRCFPTPELLRLKPVNRLCAAWGLCVVDV